MRFFLAASLFAQLASVTAFAPSCSTLSLRHHVGNGPISLRAPFARNNLVKSSSSHRSRLVQSGIQSIKASGLTEVMMPALSSTMKEGKIVQWTKTVGDRVEAGDIVMVVESDKADMDVEAFESGYLARIIVPEGSVAPVGSAVALIAATKDDIAGAAAFSSGSPAAAQAAAPAPAATAAAASAGPPAGVKAEVSMPALSSTMKEGKIVQWTKQVGDRVEAGDIVMVVESDKADMDVEAFESGFLAKILVPEGAAAPVGAAVALLVEDKADVARFADYTPAAAAAPAAAAPAPAAPAAAPTAPAPAAAAAAAPAPAGGGAGWTAPGGAVMATPQARKAAKSAGIALGSVKGTGPFGRVTEQDVLTAAGKPAAAPAPPKPAPAAAAAAARVGPELPDGPVKLTGMQTAVARNMEATLDVPVFRVARRISTDRFDELYAAVKPRGITVSALLTKAVALVLEKHPLINAHFDAKSQTIVYHGSINVANAVAIEGGLITPVIKGANMLDITALNAQWKDLVGKAKAGKLRPDEFNSGTFTVSNLGMFGVSHFGALLPPATGAILAVGGAAPSAAMRDGRVVEVRQMEVTLTADHRHIYGADSAQFLKDLADLLENRVMDLLL